MLLAVLGTLAWTQRGAGEAPKEAVVLEAELAAEV